MEWDALNEENKQLFLNIQRLNAFRKKHPVFNSLELFNGEIIPENGAKDITWLRPDAKEMEGPDWHVPYAKTGAYMLNGKSRTSVGNDDDFMVMVSGEDYHTIDYTLPEPPSGGNWKVIFDSSREGFVNDDKNYFAGDKYPLKPFSFVLLCHKNNTNEKQQQKLPITYISKGRDAH